MKLQLLLTDLRRWLQSINLQPFEIFANRTDQVMKVDCDVGYGDVACDADESELLRSGVLTVGNFQLLTESELDALKAVYGAQLKS